MEEVFLELLTFLGPQGYYARSSKELALLRKLEEKNLVKKKNGTKKVFIALEGNLLTEDKFLEILKIEFNNSKSNYQPFVTIQDLRTKFSTKYNLQSNFFDKKLLNLYKNHKIELEQSLTDNDGIVSGLLSETGKNYHYLMEIVD